MDRYEIQVLGHVNGRRARTLGCASVLNTENGRSTLIFDPLDQAALYGLLARLRDAGFELVSLARISAAAASSPSGAGETPNG